MVHKLICLFWSPVILHVIAKRMEGDAGKTMEQEELISTAFTYFSNFRATVVDLGTATALVQTLVAITVLPQHEDFSDKMSKFIQSPLESRTAELFF